MAIETDMDMSRVTGRPSAPALMQDWWHYSLGWQSTTAEESCPCPKAACGFVESGRENPTCTRHGQLARKMWNFRPRSGHPSRICIYYVRPTTPVRREAVRMLAPQVQRLKRAGLYVATYAPVEHPSIVSDSADEPDEDETSAEAD